VNLLPHLLNIHMIQYLDSDRLALPLGLHHASECAKTEEAGRPSLELELMPLDNTDIDRRHGGGEKGKGQTVA